MADQPAAILPGPTYGVGAGLAGVSVEGHTPDLIRRGEVTSGDGLQTFRRIEYEPGAGTGTLVTWTEPCLPR